MQKPHLLIDTDPGVDDALAILMAHAHANVAGGAEAGHTDGFPLEIGDGFDLRRCHNIERDNVGDAAHGNVIAALQSDIGDHLSVGRLEEEHVL